MSLLADKNLEKSVFETVKADLRDAFKPYDKPIYAGLYKISPSQQNNAQRIISKTKDFIESKVSNRPSNLFIFYASNKENVENKEKKNEEDEKIKNEKIGNKEEEPEEGEPEEDEEERENANALERKIIETGDIDEKEDEEEDSNKENEIDNDDENEIDKTDENDILGKKGKIIPNLITGFLITTPNMSHYKGNFSVFNTEVNGVVTGTGNLLTLEKNKIEENIKEIIDKSDKITVLSDEGIHTFLIDDKDDLAKIMINHIRETNLNNFFIISEFAAISISLTYLLVTFILGIVITVVVYVVFFFMIFTILAIHLTTILLNLYLYRNKYKGIRYYMISFLGPLSWIFF